MTEELRDSGLLSRIYSAASSERNLHYRDVPGDRAVKGDAVRPCQENERKRISVLEICSALDSAERLELWELEHKILTRLGREQKHETDNNKCEE